MLYGCVLVPEFLISVQINTDSAPPHGALLAVMASISFICIAISLSLYKYYEPKSDLGVLLAVPALCLTASSTACVWLNLHRTLNLSQI